MGLKKFAFGSNIGVNLRVKVERGILVFINRVSVTFADLSGLLNIGTRVQFMRSSSLVTSRSEIPVAQERWKKAHPPFSLNEVNSDLGKGLWVSRTRLELGTRTRKNGGDGTENRFMASPLLFEPPSNGRIDRHRDLSSWTRS